MTDELIVLGSSSGTPTGRRFATAFALRVTSKLFLIDCGAPVSTLLYHYGLDPIDVQAIFLSHWHADHVANLGLFLSQNHQLGRSNPLTMYGPRGSRGKIKRLLFDSFLLPDELSYKLKMTNAKPGKTYKEALLRVSFFKTQHLEKPKHKTHFGRKATAYGMILNGPGWRVVYSGDLSSPQELSPYVEGCDLLIHEMAHHRPETVAEFATAARIPHVLISHIGLEFDESPEKIFAAFAGRYEGDLIVARDGTKVQLNQIRKKRKIEVSDKITQLPPQSATDHRKQMVSNTAFLNVLQTGFNFSYRDAQALLQTAQEILAGQTPSATLKPGQIRMSVASREAPIGTPLLDEDKLEVTLTIDAPEEDIETKNNQGVAGLRQARILRLQNEALEQGGVLTQEDLARLLNVDVRTIRRDMQALKASGQPVQTRGLLK